MAANESQKFWTALLRGYFSNGGKSTAKNAHHGPIDRSLKLQNHLLEPEWKLCHQGYVPILNPSAFVVEKINRKGEKT